MDEPADRLAARAGHVDHDSEELPRRRHLDVRARAVGDGRHHTARGDGAGRAGRRRDEALHAARDARGAGRGSEDHVLARGRAPGSGEVRDSDVAGETLPLHPGERADRIGERDARVRPVDQQEVDLGEAQLDQALSGKRAASAGERRGQSTTGAAAPHSGRRRWPRRASTRFA